MSDPALQYTHSGARYLLGYGDGFFGIWDRQGSDPGPAERFPRDDAGWARAWSRFAALEPEHVVVGLGGSVGGGTASTTGTGSAEAPGVGRASGRIPGAWWLLPLVLGWIGGAIAWFALRRRDPRLAAWMFLAGIVSNIVGLWLYGQVMPPTGGLPRG